MPRLKDGSDATALRTYYGDLFGWSFDVGDATSEEVSEPGGYGFVDGATTGDGINGGVSGGEGYEPRVLFYGSSSVCVRASYPTSS